MNRAGASDWESATAPLKTAYGESRLRCFNFGSHEEDNVLVVEVSGYEGTHLVRVQSACYTAEIFRSTDCDCHEQLHRSLQAIHENGGLLVYMLADGRGAGLLTKTKALAMAEQGLDTYEAYSKLGVQPDPRTYDRAATVLNASGLSSIRLMTNNPLKVEGLEKEGFQVERVPLEISSTDDSRPYLLAKKRFGHYLPSIDAK